MHPAVFALKRAHHATQQVIDNGLAGYGLTAAQLDVLILVSRQEVEQRELQRALGVASATVANLCAAMEHRRLIERRVSPTDSRVRQVAATPAGRHLLATLQHRENERLTARFLTGLSAQEVTVLTRLLHRVAVNMGDSSHATFP